MAWILPLAFVPSPASAIKTWWVEEGNLIFQLWVTICELHTSQQKATESSLLDGINHGIEPQC